MITLVYIICILAAVGVLCWFLSTIPMPPGVKNVIWALLALFCIALLFNFATGGHAFVFR